MLGRTVLAATALTLVAAPARAQTAISGTVADSLAGRPLRGAAVQLVVEDDPLRLRTVATDAAGSFRFDAVPPGRYLLGFLHPRLDDLALQPPVKRIEVRGGERAVHSDFAIPGARTLAAATCGARSDSTGLLIGRVVDAGLLAPVDSGLVTVSWRELRVESGSIRLERRSARARLAPESAGAFAICGVPGNVALAVRATSGAHASGEVELVVPPGALLQRDLRVALPAASGATARVAGRVTGPDGAPVPRAIVLVTGSGGVDTTDASGDFDLGALAPGTRSVEARALGFVPRRIAVDLAADTTTRADIPLDRTVPALEAVTVYGKATPKRRDLTGFLERRRSGFGRYLSAEQVEKSHAQTLSDLLATVPGLRIVNGAAGETTILSRGTLDLTSQCMPDVFLDGFVVHDGARVVGDMVRPADIVGIEVYMTSATTPVEFMKGPCGAVLIWTRR